MSKYDNLNPRGLEQSMTADLKAAFEKRGMAVTHLGQAGHPDILVENDSVLIIFEPTKRRKTQQDGEFPAIRDHLAQEKTEHPGKRCYCVFVSPETSRRMLENIREHNFSRAGQPDLKICPLCFDLFELLVQRLSESVADQYPVADFVTVFNGYPDYLDDERVKKVLCEQIFPHDTALREIVEREQTERAERLQVAFLRQLLRLEQYMRDQGIATSQNAIDTLLHLVFVKLFEEKHEASTGQNRMTQAGFEAFRQQQRPPVRDRRAAIHELFRVIAEENEFRDCGMFSERDTLPDTVTDDFIVDTVIPEFSKFTFRGTKIDALGAVYEVLALKSNKDVKIGQFFTPEKVVDFMVRLAEISYKDIVVDPACGTGRFLIWAMDDMLRKVDVDQGQRDKEGEREQVRLHRLFGCDIDERIRKIAQMNMWVHGDGKTNVVRHNGLLLHERRFNGHDTFDNSVDIAVTNPPLGDIDYSVPVLQGTFQGRTQILPRRNGTRSRLGEVQGRISHYQEEITALQTEKNALEAAEQVQTYIQLSHGQATEETRRAQRELKATGAVKRYLKVSKTIGAKADTIARNDEEARQLQARITLGEVEMEVTGNNLKGGALFLNSIWHYLSDRRAPEGETEWRGGKVVIILDEGILNTDEYSVFREFVKQQFYIKAMISLTDDTFVPVSETSTKTSILYAVKKQDRTAAQREPIFFAHAEKVGLNTKRKVCCNHLNDPNGQGILQKYTEFRTAVLASYSGLEFIRQKFVAAAFAAGEINDIYSEPDRIATGKSNWYYRFPEELSDRLDFVYYHPHTDSIKAFRASESTIRFRDLVTRDESGEPIADYGMTASGREAGNLKFVNIQNLSERGVVVGPTTYLDKEEDKVPDRLLLSRGDILVSRSRLVGRAAMVAPEWEGETYGSYIIRFRLRDEIEYLAEFVVKFINSQMGQGQAVLLRTGSSGQNINSGQLLDIRLPNINIDRQREILEDTAGIEVEARHHESEAARKWNEAQEKFERNIVV